MMSINYALAILKNIREYTSIDFLEVFAFISFDLQSEFTTPSFHHLLFLFI